MVKRRWKRLRQKECQTNGFSEEIGLFLFVVSSLATFVVTQICKKSLTKVDQDFVNIVANVSENQLHLNQHPRTLELKNYYNSDTNGLSKPANSGMPFDNLNNETNFL